MVYKILHNEVILSPEMFSLKTYLKNTRRAETQAGQTNELVIPYSRTINAGHTFIDSAPKLWNTPVSCDQGKSSSVDSFKDSFSF